MSLPNTDPSLPSNPAPLFTDVDSVRGEEMRANNNLIWGNFTFLYNWLVTIASYFTGTAANNSLALNGHADTYFATQSDRNTLFSYFNGSGVANNADRLHGLNYTSAQTVDLFALVVAISSSNPDQSLIHFTISASVTTNVPYASAWHCTAQVFSGANYIVLEICDFVTAKKFYAVRNNEAWTNWIQETNVDGSVPKATNVYVNPSSILQSGSVSNNTYITANSSGFVSINHPNAGAGFLYITIYDGSAEYVVVQSYTGANATIYSFPIHAGQQFKLYASPFSSSATYKIFGAL